MKLDLSELKKQYGYLIRTTAVMPPDLNSNDKLFGGKLMAVLDEAAAMFSIMHTGCPYMVTRAIENIEFRVPVGQGNLVHYFCAVEKEGNSSLTVKVTVMKQVIDSYMGFVSEPYSYCEPVIVTETLVTMVAINPSTGKSYAWNPSS